MSLEQPSLDQAVTEAFGLIDEAQAQTIDEIREVPGARHASATTADTDMALRFMQLAGRLRIEG